MTLQTCMKTVFLCLFVSVSTGCAVTSVFSPYPNQAQEYKAAIGSSLVSDAVSAPDAALQDLSEDRESADAMLYMLERGRIAQLHNKFEESQDDYQFVIDRFEEQDLAATLDASEVGAETASLLTNDNAIPYKGAGYERIFLHHQQALNYWAKGDIEGASVEFRKVALEQQVLEEKYEAEIAEAEEEAQEKDIEIGSVSDQFLGLNTVAGEVKSSFQNAYTFYHSAAFWEAIGELNNALVDYKKTLEINPSSTLVLQDVARLSKKLSMQVDSDDTNSAAANEGVVVLLFEDGFIPAKTETRLTLPNFSDGGLVTVAFPFYEPSTWPKSSQLSVMDDMFTDYGSTEPLVDFGALAVKHLKEQVPKMIVRQVLRAIAKNELQRQSADHLGLAGQLVANIYNIVSESADRRSWLTIPHSGQALRINVKEGSRELTLRASSTTGKLKLDVKAGTTTFVRVVHVNNTLITQTFKL